MCSTSASTCQSTSRSVVWPIERMIETPVRMLTSWLRWTSMIREMTTASSCV